MYAACYLENRVLENCFSGGLPVFILATDNSTIVKSLKDPTALL